MDALLKYLGENHIVDPEGHILGSVSYSENARLVNQLKDMNGVPTATVRLTISWPRIFDRWRKPESKQELVDALKTELRNFLAETTAEGRAANISLSSTDPGKNAPGAPVTFGAGGVRYSALLSQLSPEADILSKTVKQDHPEKAPAPVGSSSPEGFLGLMWAVPFSVAYEIELRGVDLTAGAHWLVIQYPGSVPRLFACDDRGKIDENKRYTFEPKMMPDLDQYFPMKIEV